LVENGPDPVIDKDLVTEEWLIEKCRAKKVPIKALLLDQGNISGIGNWVGDEIMYNAKIHPEQYSNTLSPEQVKQLHKSIHYVCGTAVELLGDSEKFPETWLFKHRWGKGKKDATSTMPNGEKIVFLTVGGRTSAVVPSIQKKTGPVSASILTSTGPVSLSILTRTAKEVSRAESGGEEDEPEETKKAIEKSKPEVGNNAGEQRKTAPAVNGSTKKPTPKGNRNSKFKEGLSDEEAADETRTTKGRRRESNVDKGSRSTPAKKRGQAREDESESRPSVKRKKTQEVPQEAPSSQRKSGRLAK
jgi:hypothetical protein